MPNYYGNDPNLGEIQAGDEKYVLLDSPKDAASSGSTYKVGTGPQPTLPAGKYLKIGRMNYYHGHHFAGMTHTRNHLLKMGANIMYGHHHDLQQSSVTHLDGVKSAWSIGCLKDMKTEKNEWLGGRKHRWAHAFAIVDYYKGGRFTVDIVQIIDGRTTVWGQLLDGNT